MAIMKFCGPCHKEKPIEQFFNYARSKDGKGTMCKSCVKARSGRYLPKPAYNKDDRSNSTYHNSLKFLERMLFIYGADTYCINKTIEQISKDTGTPLRSTWRYLHKLKEIGLLKRMVCDRKDRSKGYKYFVTFNKPTNKEYVS